MACAIPLPRWPCRMGWMSRPSPEYWGTIPLALRLDTYTHVTTKMQEEAAEKMGHFMEMKL